MSRLDIYKKQAKQLFAGIARVRLIGGRIVSRPLPDAD